MRGVLETVARVGLRLFGRAATQDYPEVPPGLAPRTRGRLVLTRDPDGQERCVGCKLCAAACPVDCIAIEQAVAPDGRWYPERFTVNLGRCIFCGYCEEACPTAAIQLVPDVELAEWHRDAMVWEKEHLTIAGAGKVPGYTYWAVAGVAIEGKDKGEAEGEAPPIDLKGLRP